MARLSIRPGTLRDVSYVTAHMRQSDRDEAYCQLPDGTTNWQLAHMLVMSGDCWCVFEGERPIAAFGTSPMTAAAVSVWAVGTERMWRAAALIVRFMKETHIPALLGQGYRHMEARSLIDHHAAHRWMRMAGAKVHGPPMPFGKADELFLLFRWTVS